MASSPISSVQFSRSVLSDSLQPYELKHAMPPCPSPTPRVYPNSCPSSWWCYPAVSCSVVSFSSCPQSLPASRSFPMSQLFAWGVQSIGVSASASVLPMNTHHFMANRWGTVEIVTDFIFLGSKTIADSDCSHKFKRCLLLLGRKTMTNPDNALKSRNIILLASLYSQISSVSSSPVQILELDHKESWALKN